MKTVLILYTGLISQVLAKPRQGNTDDFQNRVNIEEEAFIEQPLDLTTDVKDIEDTGMINGDIVITYNKQQDSHNRVARNAVKDYWKRWPAANIPYKLSAKFDNSTRKIIKRAMLNFHKATCIRFRAAKSTDADYIQIEQNKGCHSHVGKQGGAQEVSIGLGCEHVGLVTHELMHAAGFYHEHERIDRDTFVTVHLANIMEEDARNFQIYESHDASGLKAPYDLCSIMHYGPNISSMNNKSTITVNEEYGQSNCTIGQRKGFSEIDIKKINTLYKCNGYPQTGGVSSVCIDIWDKDECEDMEVDCTSDFMQETLKENCPVTCNHCPKEPTITKAKFVEKEINPNCPTWACDGRCTSKEYKSILELQCPYSCKNDIDKEDQNESCVGWAKIKGYCRKYRHFMNAECAKTCAIAADCPNGVIAKTQTIQSPIKTASPCRDINKYCKTYKENGWCSDTQGVWYLLMQRDCSKTCRFCADSKTTTIKPTTTTQLCKDNNEYCKTYKANGWCTDTEGEWYAFMQNDCAATCLLCMTPSTPSPTSLATTAKTKVCQDKNKYCKTYNGNGWCTDTEGEWYAFMQKDCTKTCSFCT